MSRPVSLLFGVHAHQPIGNFPEVLADAHMRCYKPFLEVLFRYPEFHFAVHFSGWLLDYLFAHFPQDMVMLTEMVRRGQVELFGAGETEPVLAAIPGRDRIGQIETFSRKLATKFGQRPSGAWLTERVWDSTVVPALTACGIRYVIVDDYHFLCTGKTTEQLNGFFTTEEDACRLDIFPISEALRYKLPFSPASDAIAYIESLAVENASDQPVAAIYFDDIEKFGIWPETYQWVYEKGWLEQFVQGVLSSPQITPRHYRDYHAAGKTKGIVYLPTTSYIEMNEWTLPAESARVYADLVKQSKASGEFERNKAFLRGGIWKNFLTRYPESNWMHKRMLGLSARLAALPENPHTGEMQQKLYAAQANDAYWHGLFGGLYLPHLRRAIYHNLIDLEAMLDHCAAREERMTQDIDFDGIDETCLQNGNLQIIVRRDPSAGIVEFDAYTLKHNFGDTLRRHKEDYFDKVQLCDQHLSDADAGPHSEEKSGDADSSVEASGIASAHDRIISRHRIYAADLEPDDNARALFIDRVNALRVAYQYSDADTYASGIRFQARHESMQITKQLQLLDNRLQVTYRFSGDLKSSFSTEINLAMPSCDGPGGRFIVRGEPVSGFGQSLALENLTEITLDDDTLQGSILLKASLPVQFSAQPLFTVSQSEQGFEKIMQAVTLLLTCPIESEEVILSLTVRHQ
jgi:4-alpha-glucanotransferase/alpha-amylase